MGRCIVHHNGAFAIWSTVVDAIITEPMTESEIRAYLERETTLSSAAARPIDHRIADAKRKGTSMRDDESLAETLMCNRMGPREGRMSTRKIIENRLTLPASKQKLADLPKSGVCRIPLSPDR